MWSATVTSVELDEPGKLTTLTVTLANTDENGQVRESSTESWEYRFQETLTSEHLMERLRSAAEAKAKWSARRDLLSGFAGKSVSVPDETVLFPEDLKVVSKTDQALSDLKAYLKPLAVHFIKSVPACTLDDLFAYFNESSPEAAHLSRVLCSIYRQGAFQAGLIVENTWEALRDWIASTPTEQLMAI